MMENKRKKKFSLKSILNGTFMDSAWFRNNWMLLLMFFLMALSSITLRYKSEKVIREMTALEDSLIELRSNSIAVAAEVQRLGRHSVIIERVKKSGLEIGISKEPPRKIYVDKE
jgi:hypothetical protein